MDIASDYGQDRELIKQFFADYTDVTEDGELQVKYKQSLTALANRELRHVHIELADVEKYNQDLAKSIVSNTLRYNQLFYQALDEILPSYKTKDIGKKDITDVFIDQRLYVSERNQRNLQSAGRTAAPASAAGLGSQAGMTRAGVTDIDGQYPPDLIRRAEVYFKPSSLQATPIREVRAKHVGTLVNIRGIVTRVTDVKPKVTIVCYTCDQCGCETFQPVSDDFMPLNECSSAVCKNNKVLGKITPQLRGSKFVKYQEIKIQEHSDQVPTGNIPRAVSVMACGELTRQCSPGDHISVSGVFLPIERSGYGLRNGGLAADTKIEAHFITLMTKTEDQELNNEPMTLEEARDLIKDGQHFLSRLSSSIAPEIFGHEQLKKALLLLLVGGVETNQHGMKVRGNINICLMGDPGVAKSQLLSFIDRLAPRSQYTTGRGSSGVGLTAAVLKDPITNELVLEGGALVLADKGICCIDEFDKMMDADRTAIHEVMEQQTVSIAKAGIMTTLNARVSILAAANPAYGRYDLHRSISENLELPPALLSRFDLLWLIRDQPDRRTDLDLADHITTVHKKPMETADYDAIDMRSMRRYINLCKTIEPIVPEDLSERFVQIYLEIRARKRAKTGTDALFTSPRSLLAIMRLTTALARLRLSDVVEIADISAALELYNHSRDSIEGSLGEYVSEVNDFRSFLQRLSTENGTLELNRDMVHEMAENENFSNDFVSQALAKLSSMEALSYDGDTITLVDNPFL